MNVWSLQPPTWWPALLLLPLALLAGHWWSRRHRRQLAAEFGERVDELLGRRALPRTRAALAAAAVGLLGLALLRPVVPGREAQLAPDVALCVDVSRSMAARDQAPSRFEALHGDVEALLERGVGSRFALLAFAGEVQPIAPLTADRTAIGWLLGELLPGAVAAGGTDLAAAIDAAVRALERSGTRGDVVLLTDGEDLAGNGARAAAAAAARGHRVHCIGYGSRAGSKIVVEVDGEQRFLQDGQGVDVITRLDRDGLAAVASGGDGRFVAPGDGVDLVGLWRDELVPYAARRRLSAGDVDVVPRSSWALLAGALLLMLRLCLPERTR